MQQSEITIFKPNGTKKEVTISSLMPRQAVDALHERMGKEAADKARKAFNLMTKEGMEFIQFRIGDRRVRVKQVEA